VLLECTCKQRHWSQQQSTQAVRVLRLRLLLLALPLLLLLPRMVF
jgi:hypothetical protein